MKERIREYFKRTKCFYIALFISLTVLLISSYTFIFTTVNNKEIVRDVLQNGVVNMSTLPFIFSSIFLVISLFVSVLLFIIVFLMIFFRGKKDLDIFMYKDDRNYLKSIPKMIRGKLGDE